MSDRVEGLNVSQPRDDTSGAVDDVVTRFASFIRGSAARHGLSVHEQDEAIQDVRIRIWKALQTSENIRSAPASYVYRATVSAIVDYVRRRRTRREDELGATVEASLATKRADEADARIRVVDVEDAVERALATLPGPRQAVARLHLAGYDRFEIADLLGWTEAKTRNLLYRTLEQLRTHLTREGLDPGRND